MPPFANCLPSLYTASVSAICSRSDRPYTRPTNSDFSTEAMPEHTGASTNTTHVLQPFPTAC